MSPYYATHASCQYYMHVPPHSLTCMYILLFTHARTAHLQANVLHANGHRLQEWTDAVLGVVCSQAASVAAVVAAPEEAVNAVELVDDEASFMSFLCELEEIDDVTCDGDDSPGSSAAAFGTGSSRGCDTCIPILTPEDTALADRIYAEASAVPIGIESVAMVFGFTDPAKEDAFQVSILETQYIGCTAMSWATVIFTLIFSSKVCMDVYMGQELPALRLLVLLAFVAVTAVASSAMLCSVRGQVVGQRKLLYRLANYVMLIPVAGAFFGAAFTFHFDGSFHVGGFAKVPQFKGGVWHGVAVVLFPLVYQAVLRMRLSSCCMLPAAFSLLSATSASHIAPNAGLLWVTLTVWLAMYANERSSRLQFLRRLDASGGFHNYCRQVESGQAATSPKSLGGVIGNRRGPIGPL